jgi:protein-S-isoprenylcysteine O-methyltransferase Ste14
LTFVAISLFLLARTAQVLAAEPRNTARPTGSTQVLLGLVCGGVAALVVAVPYTDSVPNWLGTLVAAVATVATGVGIIRSRARRRRARVRQP